MRKCFYGYSHLTTGPSYYPKCTLCTVHLVFSNSHNHFYLCHFCRRSCSGSHFSRVILSVCSSTTATATSFTTTVGSTTAAVHLILLLLLLLNLIFLRLQQLLVLLLLFYHCTAHWPHHSISSVVPHAAIDTSYPD